MSEFNQEQYEQIKSDLLHFKDNEQMLRSTLMLYIMDMNYSRASISRAVSEVEKKLNYKLQ